MKLKDARSAIYSNLEKVLGPRSFKLNRSREAFERSIPEGRQSIYVSIVDLAPSFEFSIVVGLRADPVEKLVHLFSGAPEKYQPLSETAIVQLSYFMGDEPSDFIVSSIQEIELATSKIGEILKERILPLMDECKKLSVLEEKMSASAGIFDSSQPPYPMLSLLALSHIANPSRFDSLASNAIASVANFPERAQEQIQGLIAYLCESKTQ